MSVEIRRARVDEFNEIWALYEGARNEYSTWGDHYPAREHIEEDITSGRSWVLICDGEIAAAVAIIEYDDVSDMEADWSRGEYRIMARLCSARRHQGKRFARTLLEGVYRALAGEGIYLTRYLCAVSNAYALRLYEGMGDRRLGNTHIYGHDFIIFEHSEVGA